MSKPISMKVSIVNISAETSPFAPLWRVHTQAGSNALSTLRRTLQELYEDWFANPGRITPAPEQHSTVEDPALRC